MPNSDELRIANCELRMQLLYRFAMLVVILLAFGLRIYKLDAQSLWYDEGVTATVAQTDLASLTAWTANDIQPPLYYYVVAGWGRMAGWSEWSVRFPSAFWGLLAVPLIIVLTLRIRPSRSAALLTGIITALHPLLIYYSQEARMYTMLVSLGVATGYSLLRAQPSTIGNHPSTHVWWIAYVLIATAAIYTHYFAFFLLLALGINFIVFRFTNIKNDSVKRQPSQLRQFFFANLAILILYLPWFFALFTRLSNDTSYWQGEFKWWEAVRHTAITFTLGETFLEPDALRWLLLFISVSVLAVIALVAKQDWRTLGYCLVWLIVPVVCVLTLAWINPKFNARYTMVALPGLILLWSLGIGDWGKKNSTLLSRDGSLPNQGRVGDTTIKLGIDCHSDDRREEESWVLHDRILRSKKPSLRMTMLKLMAVRGGEGFALRHLFLGLFSLLLIFPFTMSIRNWFGDVAFTKAQWREMASYVKQNIQLDERIVLVSGHAEPIWRYYAPDLPAIRLPEIEILNVNAVLDYPTAAEILTSQLGSAKGVWLVDWQDEIVDPNEMAVLALEFGGSEVNQPAQFWQLRLRHFSDLNVNKIPVELPIANPAYADFGHLVTLLGITALPNDDLLLFWQRNPQSQSIPPDLWMSVELRTHSQLLLNRLGERRPANYLYPTERWQPGEVVIGRIPAGDLLKPGTLVDEYELYITLFEPQGDLAGLDLFDGDGIAQGKQAYFVNRPHKIPAGTDDPSAASWGELLPGIHLQPLLSQASIEAGKGLRVDLQWYLTQPLPDGDHSYVLNFVDQADGETVQSEAFSAANLRLVTPDRFNQVLTEPMLLKTDLAPGELWLTISPANAVTNVIAKVPLTILPASSNHILPLLTKFDEGAFFASNESTETVVVSLLGMTKLLPDRVAPVDLIEIALVWQGEALIKDYPALKATVQLIDSDGKLVSQIDEAMPIETSVIGRAVAQNLQLRAPAQEGNYQVIAAVYDASRPGLPRLLTRETKDYIELGKIVVAK